jgi:hypothetical protein
MSLRFKRNYPIVLLLIAILVFLTLGLGDQRIVAYTAKAQDQQTEPVSSNSLGVADDAVYSSQELAEDADLYQPARVMP